MLTHLIEVAGLMLQVPLIRLGLALIVVAMLWDAYADRTLP
jgi:hypothetical protein